ncbi:MAG: hypothetical protein ACM3PE_06970 [Deltaproteobacteria bacterium]
MSGENGMSQGISMSNPYKVWENLYFSAEESMGVLMKKMVETKSFANSIDLILNSYLQYLKFQNELAAAYIENTPLSSKQDTARLAKLLVALENKFDRLEDDFTNELAEIKQQTNEVLEHLDLAQKGGEDCQDDVGARISTTLDDLRNLITKVEHMEGSLKNILGTSPAPEKEAPASKKTRAAKPKQ